MSRVNTAVARFKERCSCSQAIFSTYGEAFGVDRETAMMIAAGFGGGMGRMAQTCGAVTGAFMVLGLKSKAARAKDNEAKEKTYELVREFASKFKARHGSIVCRDLLGCDIGSAEGYELAKDKKLFSTICPGMVQSAAEILEELLAR